MKVVSFIIAFLCTSGVVSAQKPDVDVFEKKEGEKVIIMARNTGKTEYTVRITINSRGMDVAPSQSVEAKVPAGYMKEMATLVPIPGQLWSYSYDISILQTVSKTVAKVPTETPATPGRETSTSGPSKPKETPAQPSLSTSEIILYAKPGCGRCTYAKKQFNSLGIKFEEVDTQSSSAEVPNMWAQMRNQGFKGGSVTMPVIRVDGKYHYDIKDLESFINNIKG